MATATQPAPDNTLPEGEPLEPQRSLIQDLIVGVATQSWPSLSRNRRSAPATEASSSTTRMSAIGIRD
jgi:hypothetical protein